MLSDVDCAILALAGLIAHTIDVVLASQWQVLALSPSLWFLPRQVPVAFLMLCAGIALKGRMHGGQTRSFPPMYSRSLVPAFESQ